VSYNRFVELLPGALVPLCCFLVSRFGQCSGINFIDSTQISVCHNRRIWSHKVMAEFAARGKTSVDGFYGFKLPLVINDPGELLGVKITAGNVDDRDPVPELARALFGKLFGDRGYISQALFEQLWEQGVQLITKLRKNMKNKLLPLLDKRLCATARSSRLSITNSKTSPKSSIPGEGVQFHEATALGSQDIAAVQREVRTRVLQLFEASIPGLAGNILLLRRFVFKRRGLLLPDAAAEMHQWAHGGGFSLDTAVCSEAPESEGAGMPSTLLCPPHLGPRAGWSGQDWANV
jgi:hypothetical protein